MKLIFIVHLFFILLFLVLMSGCGITPGQNIFAGKAVAGYSTVGCIQGLWYYEVNGKIIGRDIGCTTMNNQGIKKKEDPWCPTSIIIKNGKNVYLSGSGMWQPCSKQQEPQPTLPVKPSSKCFDSDTGLDYTTKGTLTNTNGETFTDFCSLGAVGSAGAGVKKDVSDYVYEYYCMNDQQAATSIVKCSGKCIDGQCVSAPVIDNILQSCPTPQEITLFNSEFKITSNTTLKYDCVFGVNPNFPIEKLDPRLTVYQSLRVIKLLDFSQPLPWTDKSLYSWLKETIKGVHINADFPYSFCCDPTGIINLKEENLQQQNKLKWVDPQTGSGMAYLVAVLIHEARHTTHKHTCNGYDDQTVQEMGAWGVEYYIDYFGANYLPLTYQTMYEKNELAYSAQKIKTTRFCS